MYYNIYMNAGNIAKKTLDYRTLFRRYMKGEICLQLYQQVGIVLLTVVFAGFFGWLYEFVFYYFDGGMNKFYMQGGNFLPWMNIYAIGAIIILILVQVMRLRSRPWLVFLVAILATGILELLAGWLVYTIGNGTRYWDYNTEILNFGNIGGFVCLRSVLVFGVSALMLVYLIVPFFVMLAKKMSKRAFLTLSIFLFSAVILDETVNLILKNCNLPTAMDFYRSLGLEYYP